VQTRPRATSPVPRNWVLWGREREAAATKELLLRQDVRLVYGHRSGRYRLKTRLAVEVARRAYRGISWRDPFCPAPPRYAIRA